jgi:uncharacterized lipoprotein YbaY
MVAVAVLAGLVAAQAEITHHRQLLLVKDSQAEVARQQDSKHQTIQHMVAVVQVALV